MSHPTEFNVEDMLAEIKACEVLVQALIDCHDPEITIDTRTCLEYFDKLMLKLKRIKELCEK